ncbi:MAG TPA: hypothetical protein VKH81_18115 [Candidatus Angelobacter sp.]|nr:hypothetical protein [Candidatus Angelobacter sp.]
MNFAQKGFGRWVLLTAFLGTVALMAVSLPLAGQNSKTDSHGDHSAGFLLSDNATPDNVGLPAYPGAKRATDSSDDSSALQMGLWGPSAGFKLILVKLDSKDSPEKVAAFYRKALAKYGEVLDCGKMAQEKVSAQADAASCESDQPADGGFTLKAGTRKKQRIVGIEPRDGKTRIALVYLEDRNPDSKKD